MRRGRLWLALGASLLCLGWADSWQGLRDTAATVTSVQADFVQEKHLPILARPLVSRGILRYRKPGSLRWEYREPVASVMLMHEGRTRRLVGGPAGWTEESGRGLEAMQVVMEEITGWLGGRFDGNPMFEARLEPGRRIVLVPKDEGARRLIQRVELGLGERPGALKSVTVFESESAFTRMSFSNVVLNGAVADADFRKVP